MPSGENYGNCNPPSRNLHLGTLRDFNEVDKSFEKLNDTGFKLDREFSQLSPDSRMTTSSMGLMTVSLPSMTDEDWDAIERHTGRSLCAFAADPEGTSSGRHLRSRLVANRGSFETGRYRGEG